MEKRRELTDKTQLIISENIILHVFSFKKKKFRYLFITVYVFSLLLKDARSLGESNATISN